jgi:pimeloyl-ACP methyl ester carboxylesterase
MRRNELAERVGEALCRRSEFSVVGLSGDENRPIAVLWGDRDAVIPIAHGKALVQAMEGVKLTELTGCGHYLHHDDPKSFLMGVREALDASSWPPVRVIAAASAWRAANEAADSRPVDPGAIGEDASSRAVLGNVCRP